MILNNKTLERLRVLINEETEYRSGPNIIKFFNQLGFNDSYGQGFPSRHIFTDGKLNKINGTSELDKCIKSLFTPVNYIGNYGSLDKHIASLNEYLAFDGWQVVRKNTEITFTKSNEVNFNSKIAKEQIIEETEKEFLSKNFDLPIDKLKIDAMLFPIIKSRIEEIQKCMKSAASLAIIFLCGSTLEGVLLNIATQNPQIFNKTNSSPKNHEGKVKPFQDWTLNNFIDVSYEAGFLKEDVKKFSHGLKDFRNYIHPYEQMSKNFNPDIQTAEICFQVLKAGICQIIEKQKTTQKTLLTLVEKNETRTQSKPY